MRKLIALFSLILTIGLVGCSNTSKIKNVPITDIKSAINNETLLTIQPVSDVDAKEFYLFENIKDNIKEGFVLQAMMNVKLQDVFVVKTDNVEKVKQTKLKIYEKTPFWGVFYFLCTVYGTYGVV